MGFSRNVLVLENHNLTEVEWHIYTLVTKDTPYRDMGLQFFSARQKDSEIPKMHCANLHTNTLEFRIDILYEMTNNEKYQIHCNNGNTMGSTEANSVLPI